MFTEAFDCTATENGFRPAVTSEERTGRNRTRTTPSASGKSDRVVGSVRLQRDGSPTTLMSYWSTTLLLLRIRTSAVASSPGLTVTTVGANATVIPPESASALFPS